MSIEDIDTIDFLNAFTVANSSNTNTVSDALTAQTGLTTLLRKGTAISEAEFTAGFEAMRADPSKHTFQGLIDAINAQAGANNITQGEINAFLEEFGDALGVDIGTSATTVAGVLGDWDLLSDSDFINTTSVATAKDSVKALLILAMNKFVKRYAETVPQGAVTKASNLLANGGTTELIGFYYYSTGQALVEGDDPTKPLWTSAVSIPEFETMFYAFFPSATENDFKAHLAYFTDQAVFDDGYFLPAHHFEAWIDHLRLAVGPSTPLGNLTPFLIERDPVQQTKLNQTRILLRVLQSVIDMIGVIQQVAVAQAGRLEFYGDWQKAYSDLMDQMPTWTKGDESYIGGGKEITKNNGNTGIFGNVADSDGGAEARTDLNQDGSALVETLRTARELVADTAKQLQTNVNQTNDAASAQANIATAILQQLSGILATILR